jgi:hypothetical protein
MIKYNNINFDNNPNNISESVQFMGAIYLDDLCIDRIVSVYGISQDQIMELVEQFKQIEPNAKRLVLYGTEDWWGYRKIVNNLKI